MVVGCSWVTIAASKSCIGNCDLTWGVRTVEAAKASISDANRSHAVAFGVPEAGRADAFGGSPIPRQMSPSGLITIGSIATIRARARPKSEDIGDIQPGNSPAP